MRTAEERRQYHINYCREYYRKNRERILAQGRERYRDKCSGKKKAARVQVVEAVNPHDIQHTSPEKAARMINMVLTGRLALTRTA